MKVTFTFSSNAAVREENEMKITRKQLREMIIEEEERLHEKNYEWGTWIAPLLAAWRDDMISMYDPGDQTMRRAGGKRAWLAQVDDAAADAEDQIASYVGDTLATYAQRLIDGEFYRR
jgi:hypothetical protein